ncbi:MAG: tetratricopeptide repeat protein [Magnetovibrio sp.]|nr:tetratricopeptide repeat protein [Magnetovibrio sp.]
MSADTTLDNMRSFVQVPIGLTIAFCMAIAQMSGAKAETIAEAQQHYHGCMALTETNPEAAFDDATTWEGLGGGHPARHCALAALIAIGHMDEAAQGLEKLADEVSADAVFKSKLLLQSARAWIAANKLERATATADYALKLNPELMGAHFTRAQAMGIQGAYAEAIIDLTAVLRAYPGHPEVLVMRGSAYRFLDKLDLALMDLDRALDIQPTNVEGLLERGNVYRLMGRKNPARNNWLKVIELEPDSDAARVARVNIHNLNSGVN